MIIHEDKFIKRFMRKMGLINTYIPKDESMFLKVFVF